MSELILREQAEMAVKVKTALSIALGDLREEVRQIMSDQTKIIRQIRAEVVAQPQTPAATALNRRDYIQLSGRVRLLKNELVQIYEALADLCAPDDDALARFYMHQALSLTADPVAAAEVHYALACLLARQGELGNATVELQAAFRNGSRELEKKLTRDTEKGGLLYALATTPPHDNVVNDLLMNVSVGA